MIVPTMTHAEAYRELDKDRENVERWFEHRFLEMRRLALKSRRFPMMWWREYRSPRHNHYILFTVATSRKFDNHTAVTTLALRREERGYSVYLTKLTSLSHVRRMVCMQHVFDRYAERAGIDKQGIDLIKHMFSQQGGGSVVNNQSLAGRSVRYEGRLHRFMAIQDGILLGDVADGIFIARTFITYEMATGKQKTAFTRAQSLLLNWEDEQRLIKRMDDTPIGGGLRAKD